MAVVVTLVDLLLVIELVFAFVSLVLTVVVVLCLLDEVVEVDVEVLVVLSVQINSASKEVTFCIRTGKRVCRNNCNKESQENPNTRDHCNECSQRKERANIEVEFEELGTGFISIRRPRLFLEP